MVYLEQFRVIKSKPDEHCLVSSVATSLRRLHGQFIDNERILQLICSETNGNYNNYAKFILPTDELTLQEQLNEYVNFKIYNSTFGDMAPLVIAGTLRVDHVMVEKQATYGVQKFITGGESDEKKYIYMFTKMANIMMDFIESVIQSFPPAKFINRSVSVCTQKHGPQITLAGENPNDLNRPPNTTDKLLRQDPTTVPFSLYPVSNESHKVCFLEYSGIISAQTSHGYLWIILGQTRRYFTVRNLVSK